MTRTIRMKLEDYFEKHGFKPNQDQENAINHLEGPLLLVAGPGSGKTRVLLWRTFNLIVFHDVTPSEIFLSTFSKKAAKQLKDGLLTLLGSVPDRYFDTSEMYVGTVHSLCLRILTDKRFKNSTAVPELMDDVDQYFHIYKNRKVKDDNKVILALQQRKGNSNGHKVTIGLISLFNRLSEECLSPKEFGDQGEASAFLAEMYQSYLESLKRLNKTDQSLLQQAALTVLTNNPKPSPVFKHLLIDEYQDTNTVQESIFYQLANDVRNLCVVGDDDQSLYRFRGATVENLVQFPTRCLQYLKVEAKSIYLLNNYRSSPQIVKLYNQFIKTDESLQQYRFDKTINAQTTSTCPSVILTSKDTDRERCEEIADLVKRLIDEKKITDPSQIAFLYPSVKDKLAKNMMEALANRGLSVYSPRFGRFLECEEAKLIFGFMVLIFGKIEPKADRNFQEFHVWLSECEDIAKDVYDKDHQLKGLIKRKNDELAVFESNSSTQWSLLDLFYELLALDSIKLKFSLAETGGDESPTCNLSLISQYLLRFQKMYGFSVIQGSMYGARGKKFRKSFFTDYLYGLFRLQKSDYENAETPFPKGRIPFLTIHQAKGLEFPVVVLGSLNLFPGRTSTVETLVRPLVKDHDKLEPLESVPKFDAMRMFYVALSRAENLLILANTMDKGAQDKRHPGLVSVVETMDITKINDFDISQISIAKESTQALPKTYSYTSDYQVYLSCPRQYMLFRKYGFAPSKTRIMAFGVLVHKTIEDIHLELIHNENEIINPDFIEQRVDANYKALSQEGPLTLSTKRLDDAKEQVNYYWSKLEGIARSITDTEVPLTLSNQETPKGIKYSIYGVVDMALKGGDSSHLYDIKTHSADSVRANPGAYQEQLNVYAYIWQELHKQKLSGTSIIATELPSSKEENDLVAWEPLVPLEFSKTGVDETIESFGCMVDKIEQREFQPRTIEDLKLDQHNNKNLAQELCRHCDGRFSCNSYVTYLNDHPKEKGDESDNIVVRPLLIEEEINNLPPVYMQTRGKESYLNDTHVTGFIDYLKDLIKGSTPLDHSYMVDPVNKHFYLKDVGKKVTFDTIQDAFKGYVWKREGYAENKSVLDAIAEKLRTATTEEDLYQACLECLEWGAGSKSSSLYDKNENWLWEKRSQTSLIALLDNSYNQLANEYPNLNGFKSENYRMNSGFTKIYALKYDDFIIYDSRVAAALGLLVVKYCEANELNEIPGNLKFHYAHKYPRGVDKRNPCVGDFQFPRLSYANSSNHAESNVKANWLLAEVVRTAGEFWEITNGSERLRALEAALFMVGYSVIPLANSENTMINQGINVRPALIQQIPVEEVDYDELPDSSLGTLWGVPIRQGVVTPDNVVGGWVPTTHDFTKALNFYIGYRQTNPDRPNNGDFKNYIGNGVGGNWYIQNRNEFTLNGEELPLIHALWKSQFNINAESLRFLNRYRQSIIDNEVNQNQDEDIWNNFPKYLMDTYLCGKLAGNRTGEIISILQWFRYAGVGNGNGNPSKAIIQVGESFGRHFGFLNENNYPTELFNLFFLTTEPLNDWIGSVVDMSQEGN